jgi:signal transduction histidine kinase
MRTRIGIRWFFLIVTIQIAIFFLDVFIVEDDVSIGFLYTLPTLMCFFVRDRVLQVTIIGISVVLIIVGCFIPLPVRDDLLVFAANRFLSVITVIITGVMVYIRVTLAQTLADALIAEKDASATQRAFVSMISHEFRMPLAVIEGEACQMIDNSDHIAPEEIAKCAGVIRESVTRMVALIEAVLYSSRAQENKIVLHVESVDLRILIREVCRQRARAAPNHRIVEILLDLPAIIQGDRNLLTYVFDNIIANAVKYSSDKSIINISGKYENNFAVISIQDYGIGIPADDQLKLFEPYFRASNSAGFRGSGVGLYIVRSVVRLHGGRVMVQSELGQGSIFTVYLPLHPPSISVNGNRGEDPLE